MPISLGTKSDLNRDFSASALNQKWLADITEFQIPAGKAYLSLMIDCHDGLVVSSTLLPGETQQHPIAFGAMTRFNPRPTLLPDETIQRRSAGDQLAVASLLGFVANTKGLIED